MGDIRASGLKIRTNSFDMEGTKLSKVSWNESPDVIVEKYCDGLFVESVRTNSVFHYELLKFIRSLEK